MGDFGKIAQILAENDGIITTQQALGAGLTHDHLRGRVDRGEWLRLFRSLYRSASHEFTEAAMVRAVVLAHHGCADSATAAWWHGMLDDLPSPLTVSCEAKPPPLDWPVSVRAVRRKYQPGSVVEVRGLPVTAKPLTALMAAVELDDGTAYLDRWLQTGAVDLADLQRALDDNAGMRGIVEARRLVNRYRPSPCRSPSASHVVSTDASAFGLGSRLDLSLRSIRVA
ncbi:type IV toxin-antitoxin system AbiEi family antitoxin domain-containing protein [Gordonia phthalatica]|uniref:type IV toxin-antitoxin system AbiEi family antitoxin domain-containing protein n=1 Tax=Gordonia phthalatica TaxID=1136941 RepID=UPI000781919B|nr:type IV toxin-antitoxin system AbiEi family antitoxin domain-containing protein [Gordonia phthalatica]